MTLSALIESLKHELSICRADNRRLRLELQRQEIEREPAPLKDSTDPFQHELFPTSYCSLDALCYDGRCPLCAALWAEGAL